MNKFKLILVLFLFNLSYVSSGIASGSVGKDDVSSKGFAAFVSQPFLQNPTSDFSFFSDPKQSYSKWNAGYQAWGQIKTNVNAFTMFETIGRSKQGFLASYDSKYQGITEAQAKGMIGLIKGDLGFQNRSCTRDEQKILIDELLNLGRSFSREELSSYLAALENAYDALTNTAQKHHLQLSALLLLAGNRLGLLEKDKWYAKENWYLKELERSEHILQEIDGYRNFFFEEDPALIQGENYKELVKAANASQWNRVSELLKSNSLSSSVIQAISRLSGYHDLPEETRHSINVNYLFDLDTQTVQRASRKIISRPSSPSIEQHVESYLDQSRILLIYPDDDKQEVRKFLRKAIKHSIAQNGNQWPGENLKVAEQFFWNLNVLNLNAILKEESIITSLFQSKIPGTWKDFKVFSKLYGDGKPENAVRLFPIYQAFPDATARQGFLDFCTSYLVGVENKHKPIIMENLLPIYQAFPDATARQGFLDFCTPYLVDVENRHKPDKMKYLPPLYQAFPDAIARQCFLDFCTPYLGIYFKLPDMKMLLPIYQAFPDAIARQGFLDFCTPYLVRAPKEKKPIIMKEYLLPIYQSGSTSIEDFQEFMNPHLPRININYIENLMSSYLSRSYLKYPRVDAALKAEVGRIEPPRLQAMYGETDLDETLPILYAQDPFLNRVHAITGEANAHDFDAVYEMDRPILWAHTGGYNSAQSSVQRVIYNNREIKEQAYAINIEVEDFINYLDMTIAKSPGIKVGNITLTGIKVVSVIKQMLGLEQKGSFTKGGFAPYLSSSIYYAKPESPKGDEMLGRTWFYIKNLPGNEQDKEIYKKNVVNAFLEATEISTTSVDTHCQTRITGELMKTIAWALPGSKLKTLIAAKDLPPETTPENIKERIDNAPIRAHSVFKNIKEAGGEFMKLLHSHSKANFELPLWKIYGALYDDLYRRIKGMSDSRSAKDANGYILDENILIRNTEGDLVRTLDRGTPQERTEIVYYQAEFQVLEKTITDLINQEFEEQRGLIY